MQLQSLAYDAFIHARDEMGSRVAPLEWLIAKDAIVSVAYAIEVIGGPFELAEPLIAERAEVAYFYALKSLKGRFPAGEDAIRNSPLSGKYDAFIASLN